MSHITIDEALSELDEINESSSEIDLDLAPRSKTHQIVRFKMTISDAEDLSELISKTRHEQGFTESDDLTNAGDALAYLLWRDDDE